MPERNRSLQNRWKRLSTPTVFNPMLFAAAIPTMHRTLQQSLWRLIKECVKVIADEKTGHDDRNMASHLEAKEMLEYLNKHGRHIPFV